MKTSFKIFAYAVAASVAFFSCNVGDDSANLNSLNVDNGVNKNDSLLSEISILDSILSSSLNIEMPIAMDSRVVSYKLLNRPQPNLGFKYRKGSLILGRDTLESLFPHILNDKQAESQCDYFALYFGTSSTFIRYWVLSQDIIYEVKPVNADLCPETEDLMLHAMLVCDDKAGTLRESINIDSIQPFNDPNWYCLSGKEGTKSSSSLSTASSNSLSTTSSNSTASSSSLSRNPILSSSSTAEMPIAMDSRVVSYKLIGNDSKPRHDFGGYKYRKGGLILGRDTLESLFPHILSDKQAESQCDYFALHFGTSSTFIRYWVLSQDIIYEVKPINADLCPETEDIAYHVMLVCDDNAGTLRESINIDSTQSFNDPNWDCEKENNLSKKVFF